MFVRKKKNKSGTVSVQIVLKSRGNYKVIKTIGCAKTTREEELMYLLANTELERLSGNQSLFVEHDDLVVDNFVNSIANDHLQIVGSELILGKIYEKIGFPEDGCPDYFRNLVLCRLVYPGSKLKTVEYFRWHLNINRGYNKYLKLSGEVNISIDYEKYQVDCVWDGLKGYVTNTHLSRKEVIENYCQLWQIEKAFRISKTDLRIRPIYHRLKDRIEAHICICFTAYAVYKELERLLWKNKVELSPEKAIAQIKEIRQLQYVLPKSKQMKTKILKPTVIQERLINMDI